MTNTVTANDFSDHRKETTAAADTATAAHRLELNDHRKEMIALVNALGIGVSVAADVATAAHRKEISEQRKEMIATLRWGVAIILVGVSSAGAVIEYLTKVT